jgi:signal transduction histidine kinase
MANSAANLGLITEKSTCYQLTHKRDEPCNGIEHPCTILEIKKTKEPVILEHTHFDKDGDGRFFEVHGYPILDAEGNVVQIIEYNLDVTEQKKLEDQLRQSQKMESIGKLAGGIAHDFNNLLTSIVGYSEMLLDGISNGHPLREKIEIILDSGKKAASLTRQLLAFSRKQMLEMKIISISHTIEDLSKMLRRVIGEDITLKLKISPSVKNVKADPSQIEQILMNLAVNARQAMPDGGYLIIETKNVHLDEEYVINHAEVKPGAYVMLAVTDTGKGMSRDVQEKIFEPFFTTKGVTGTGLGLATVYGIVKQHNGYVYVYSEIGRGTTFNLYFPATEEVEETPIPEIKTATLHGDETVLVVDDESLIRRIVLETLEPLGYNVLEASSGKEALNLSETTEGDITLLLTDVIMPEMNGRELFESIRSGRPSIKVIFMSGYTDDIIERHGIFETGETFIKKPITPSKLARKVRDFLDVND